LPTFFINNTDQIFYEMIEGRSDFPVLVFLHEGLGCHAMWKEFPQRLCRKTGCQGLVYDRLGHGKSSPLTSARAIHYMHESALQELPRVIQHCIPRRFFILIGHSDGGSISLIFGAQKPSLLSGIITEAAHVFVEPVTVEGVREVDEAFKKGELAGLKKYHGKKTDSIFGAWADTWLSGWFQSWNIEDVLSSIECPVLVIQGREDQYGSERQVRSIVSGISGGAIPVVVSDCRHTPHQEAPETLLAIMSEFVDRIISRNGGYVSHES
jgi:pimeloyl-ACP methyl ester carboxylesterase